MQENPRYSLDEIRLLLSQYLDGALDDDRLVETELMLEQPEIQAELLRLQETKGLLHQALQPERDLRFSKVSDTAWKNIARQLEADNATQPAHYDFEFISAYYDGELDPSDPAHHAFEAQLLHNDNANRMLADIGELSEALRRFGYRQEEACAINLTEQVMQAYKAEEERKPSHLEAIPEENAAIIEMVSAFVDEELSAKEIIELNRLIERDDTVREQLAGFNRVSDAVRFLAEKMSATAPTGFWLKIKDQVQEQPTGRSGKILPFPGPGRSSSREILGKVAMPAAAAALLVLLSIPSLRESNFEPSTSRVSNLQLASVPMSSAGMGLVRASYRVSGQTTEGLPASPVESPSRLVSGQEGNTRIPGNASPSSEEYLFRALEEQAAESDLSNILGK